MRRTHAILAASGLVLTVAVTGCSSDESATGSTPSGSLVGGTTECTDATITQAINDVVSADDSGVSVVSLDNLICADGWAAAEATVSNGADGGGITETFIFEAEGQFWVPKSPDDVCGTLGSDLTARPDDAQVPADAWALACTTN